MILKLYKRISIIFLVVVFLSPSNIFAATSDKNFTLDDSTGDSPQVILTDADDNNLTLQKMDSGEADLVNDEGTLNLKVSGDTDDYLQFLTTGNSSYLYWLGVLSYTNNPGLRVNPTTGKIEYRDEDSTSWVPLDDLGSGSATFNGLSDTTLTSIAQGDLLY